MKKSSYLTDSSIRANKKNIVSKILYIIGTKLAALKKFIRDKV